MRFDYRTQQETGAESVILFRVDASVWNARRKWLGNLIPGVVFLIPFGYGLLLALLSQPIPIQAYVWMGAAIVCGYFALNTWGLFQNSQMRSEMRKRVKAPPYAIFVGIATPGFASAIDPHEDVGFLWVEDQKLIVAGELYSIVIDRVDVAKVSFSPNVHTILGLGGWSVIDGAIGNDPFKLKIEPRQKDTLFGNVGVAKKLRASLRAWLESGRFSI
jgi:hypothetical protein